MSTAVVLCFGSPPPIYIVKHLLKKVRRFFFPRAHLPVLQWQCNLRLWLYSSVLALKSWCYWPSNWEINKIFWGTQSQRDVVILGPWNNVSTGIIKLKPDKRMKGCERRYGRMEAQGKWSGNERKSGRISWVWCKEIVRSVSRREKTGREVQSGVKGNAAFSALGAILDWGLQCECSPSRALGQKAKGFICLGAG